MQKHLYSSGNVSGFRFRITLDGDTDVAIKFKDGQFKTDDEKLAAAIDKQLTANVSISRYVKKIDVKAAEKIARDHQALMNRTGAVRGMVTTDMVRQAQNKEVGQRDAELLQKAAENVQELAQENDNLTLTVPGNESKQPEVAKPSQTIQPVAPVKQLLVDTPQANVGVGLLIKPPFEQAG